MTAALSLCGFAGPVQEHYIKGQVLTGRAVSTDDTYYFVGDVGVDAKWVGIEPLYAPGTLIYVLDDRDDDACPTVGDQIWQMHTTLAYAYDDGRETYVVSNCQPLTDQTLFARPSPALPPAPEAAAELARHELALQTLAGTFSKKTTVGDVVAMLGVEGYTQVACPGDCELYRITGGDRAPFVAEFTTYRISKDWDSVAMKVVLTGGPSLCFSQPGWAAALPSAGKDEKGWQGWDSRTWAPQVRVEDGSRIKMTSLLLTVWSTWNSGSDTVSVGLSPLAAWPDPDRVISAADARSLMDRSACLRSLSIYDQPIAVPMSLPLPGAGLAPRRAGDASATK